MRAEVKVILVVLVLVLVHDFGIPNAFLLVRSGLREPREGLFCPNSVRFPKLDGCVPPPLRWYCSTVLYRSRWCIWVWLHDMILQHDGSVEAAPLVEAISYCRSTSTVPVRISRYCTICSS